MLMDQLGAKLAAELGLDARSASARAAKVLRAIMRIVAGKFRSARIEAPKGLATRPTSDRVRQALFNVLEHGAPQVDFDGARVLDLFAGSGALGLEALSRGARFCLFVEESADARAAIRRNVEALHLTGAPRSGGATRPSLAKRGRCSPSTSSSSTRLTAKVSAQGAAIRRF